MNRSLHFLLLAAAASWSVTAADMPTGEGTLDADQSEFDLAQGILHADGNVRFHYPGMLDLECDNLRLRMLPGGDKIDRMTASNHVVITLIRHGSTNLSLPVNRTTGTNRIHAAVAEYTSTNDTVTFTGSPTFGQPWVEGAEGSFRADVITFDRTRDKIDLKGNFRLNIRPDALPKGALGPSRTNRPAGSPVP
ncbi:MAG: hypothetical protein JNL10_20660 [Verrucomicrobiales bacterium]|nr:hypothetical protein [Verrucomicrobiales bacterium]